MFIFYLLVIPTYITVHRVEVFLIAARTQVKIFLLCISIERPILSVYSDWILPKMWCLTELTEKLSVEAGRIHLFLFVKEMTPRHVMG